MGEAKQMAMQDAYTDKIIFKTAKKKTMLRDENFVFYDSGTVFDIKVVDDPATVKVITKELVDFLQDRGWKLGKGTITQDVQADDLKIIDVEYAIKCPSGSTPEIPPDK